MTSRDRIILAVVLLVGALAGYWFLLLAPQREEMGKLDAKIAEQRKALDESLTRVQAGLQARSRYSANYAMVAKLGQAVPADDSVPSLVFQLDSAATTAGVDFRKVKLANTNASSSSSTPPSTSTSTSASTAGGATSAAALPPGAAVGPAGFPTMPFSLSFDGSFFHMAAFLRRLDRFVAAGGRTVRIGGRLLTVEGIALSASRKGFPKVKATIAATAYLVPPGQGLTGGATPQGPAGTQPVSSSSAAPTTTPASSSTTSSPTP